MSYKILLIVSFLSVFMGCKEDPPIPELKFYEGKGTLAIGQTGLYYSKNDSEPIKIKLIAVISDSRCPEGAYCIWEGGVSAEFLVNGINYKILAASMGNQSVNYKNKKIFISGANPYPRVNAKIDPRKYTVEFTVEVI
ncbi:MAG: hypothetical protein HUU47_07305 [Bacteroidetes bacterium]|nr:hypothetical protein [Bacteroidota bacterium]